MTIITGKAYWAFLGKKNTMNDAYSMDLGMLDKENVAKVEAMGLTVKEEKKFEKGDPNYRGKYISLKTANFAPKVIDSKKNAFDASKTLIGNGSIVKVAVSPYEWDFKNEKTGKVVKSGISAGLGTVQVIQLVKYEKDDTAVPNVNEFDVEDGFEAEEIVEDNSDDSFEIED